MTVAFTPNPRYPDPAVEVLDDAFRDLRLYSASVEQLATGFRWAEGPVWFGDGRYLLFSDIPNNRILRWDETLGRDQRLSRAGRQRQRPHPRPPGPAGVVRAPARAASRAPNTTARITVLADRFDGKRLNSPNDIVCARDGAIWFTDPTFGIAGHWEGEPATPELPHAVYRLPPDGPLQRVIDDLKGPNGLAFSPDESELYVVESRAEPHRRLWAYRVGANGALSNKRLVHRRRRRRCARRHRDRRAGPYLVRLRQQRPRAVGGPGRRARVRSHRAGHRPHPPARALRQPVLRRREEQPPVHGQQPFALRAVCEHAGRVTWPRR